MVNKVLAVLAVIAIGSFASVLKFKDAGSDDCTISNVGGTLQAGCGSDSPRNILQSDNSAMQGQLDFMNSNIMDLYDHMPCRPGQFRPTTNPFVDENDSHTDVCMVCPGDSYTDEFNFAGTCTACPTGYKHDNSHDHTYCDVCAPGYGFITGARSAPTVLDASHTFCSACGPNEYQQGADLDTCSTCPPLTHTDSENTQSACTKCDAGYERTAFDADGHAVCSACTLGETYATTPMQTCEALSGCAVGMGARTGLSFYDRANDSPTSYCEACNADTVYSDADDLSACEDHDPCPAGQGVANHGSVSDIAHRTCETCDNTHYSSSNVFHRCWQVGAGYAKTSSTTAPLQCANNYYSSGSISYTASTGAKSSTVCHQCSTCSTQVKTACNTADGRGLSATTGSNTACCTSSDKPDYATLSSTGAYNQVGNACKYDCNAHGTGTACTDCETGYQWQNNQCVAVPAGPTSVNDNYYCRWPNYQYEFNQYGSANGLTTSCRERALSQGKTHFFTYMPGYTKYCYTCSQGWTNAGANQWQGNGATHTYTVN